MKAREAFRIYHALAEKYGFSLTKTAGGHVRFERSGCPPVFASSSPRTDCGPRKVESDLKRALQGAVKGA
jgi:predicted RNA binding protein YcfA (HicA-like mRNA interferase family)